MIVKKYGKIKIKKSSITSILLMVWLYEIFLLTVARYILSSLGFYEGFVRSLVLTSIASIPLVFFLLVAHSLKSSDYIPFLVLYLVIVIAFALTALYYPEYEYFFTRSKYGLERVFRPDCALYAFLFYSLVDKPEDILKILKKFAYLDFVYLITIELIPSLIRGYWIDVNYIGKDVHRAYSLSFGYSMLFPTIVLLYFFIKEKKIIALLCSVIGCWSIFTQGSRGALLIPVIFIGLMTISSIIESSDMSKKVLKISGIVILMIVVCFLGSSMLRIILSFLASKGIESRTLELLISGDFSGDSGRIIIWRAVINAIKNGGILGYGAYGDRPIVYPFHYVGYSHNLFLELICSFGVVGIMISIFIIVGSMRMIATCKNRLWRELFIIFFSIACQLFLSLSFWYVTEFWAALAIAHKYYQLKKTDHLLID